MDNTKTGNLIRQLRKEKGLTQKDIAQQLHITDRAVSKWERGLCAPDIALLDPLSKILGVSILALINGTPEEAPQHTVDSTIAVIDYSSREIVENGKKSRRTLYLCIGVSTLILCLLTASMVFSHLRDQRHKETLFMSHMYAKLRDIDWIIDDIHRAELTPQERSELLLNLHYALHSAQEQLEDGAHYVSDHIPGVASWWFSERAAYISNNFQTFQTEHVHLSQEGARFLDQLQKDLRELMAPMVGEDQMNLNQALTIDAFSDIIFQFYQTH